MFQEANFSALRNCILRAGDAIMEFYNRPEFDVQSKSDSSPVTEADLAADKIIYETLKSLFPNEVIITEEKSESHQLKAERFFIIDPLDGTKEFVQRRGDFTVNIGYVENGVPVFGMVYAPAKLRLFYTFEGKAYEEFGPFDKDQIGERNIINVRVSDNNALKIVASKSHRDAATDEYIAKYNVAEFNSAGSSMKFCLVAAGEADFYPRLGPTMEWDTAAADAVTRAAGGQVLDFDTQKPLLYGKTEFRNPFFLVTSANLELRG